MLCFSLIMSLGLRNKRLKLFLHKQIMGSCADNCSGHGECFNGTCYCEVCIVLISLI